MAEQQFRPTHPFHYPAIPHSIVCALEEQRIVEDMQDIIFNDVMASLGYVSLALISLCTIRRRHILREHDDIVPGNETNDSVTELQIKERTVASILRFRTDYNHVQALFAHYLNDDFVDRLRCKI